MDAAIALRDWSRAEALLAEGRRLQPNDPRIPMLEARLARAWGDQRRARRALERAAELRRSQIGLDGTLAVAASGQAVPPGGAQSSPALYANPFRRVPLAGQGFGSATQPSGLGPATTGDPLLLDINRQLSEVREDSSPHVTPSFGIRARSGDQGMDRLMEGSAGVEGSASLPGIGGRLTASATAVSISSGDLEQSLPALRRFGSNPLMLPGLLGTLTPQQAQAASRVDTSASGVALGLAYTRPNLSLDVGTTPLGFPRQDIVGGIDFAPEIGDGLRLRVTGERRAVTDSVLSWAGMRDPMLGQTWGGVTRNTLRAQIEYGAGDAAFYVGGGYSTLGGENVADNARMEAGAGVSYTLYRRPDDELTTGLDVTYFSYDKNLRFFTLGHGGYFSPQSFAAATVPVDWRARSGSFAWRLGASLGITSFREDRTPIFPNDRGLQAALEGRTASEVDVAAYYPGQTKSGLSGGLRGDIEYTLLPQLRVGALLRYDRSADWDEGRGMVYARYRFDR